MKANKLLFLLSTFVATAASAGDSVNWDVSVSLGNPSIGYAGGAIAAARNSADTNQYIGCIITVNYINTSTPQRTLKCQAVDAAGNAGSCTLNSPPQSVVDLITSLDDTSFLGFFWNKPSLVCTQLFVERSSMQVPSGGTPALTATRAAAPVASPMPEAREQK